ncbi:MAG: hypothetical protein R6V45_05950, partial [Oceanipulchritudo sp.]
MENAGEALLAAEEALQEASDLEKPGQGKPEAAADLVVSDLVIPRIDGKRFLDRLRQVMPGLQGMLLTEYTAEQLGKKGL